MVNFYFHFKNYRLKEKFLLLVATGSQRGSPLKALDEKEKNTCHWTPLTSPPPPQRSPAPSASLPKLQARMWLSSQFRLLLLKKKKKDTSPQTAKKVWTMSVHHSAASFLEGKINRTLLKCPFVRHV